MNRNLKKIVFIGLLSVLLVSIISLLTSIKDTKNKDYPINSLRVDSNNIYIDVQKLWANQDYGFDDIADIAEGDGIFISIIDLHENIIYSNSQYIDLENVSILQEALYMDASYLKNNPNVRQDLTLIVRHLQPEANKGLPIEIYCFLNDTRWGNYEALQADIFDHILAALPFFGLRTYQRNALVDQRM